MRDFTIDLIWTKVQVAVTALGGWFGYFIGGVDGFMTALIILMALDYITGIMCAIVDKKLSSSIGFKGIFKKMLIIMLVGVAHIVDLNVVGSHEALRSAVICFYLSNEGVSSKMLLGWVCPFRKSSRQSLLSCMTRLRSPKATARPTRATANNRRSFDWRTS